MKNRVTGNFGPPAVHGHHLLNDLSPRLLAAEAPLPLSPARSDFDLNPALRPSAPRVLTPSAVVIPIVARPEPSVLFTKRAAHLPRHPGQVSFPGGMADPSDVSLTATALRELEEETGITANFVTVAGYLEPYETVTGFAVQPVVGILAEGFVPVSDPREVERVFEVPLSLLLDPASLREEALDFRGATRKVYGFHAQGEYIWGATASMLVALRERLS